MEILAPAGSLNQAWAAIKSGCDALYGGLKEWSARNRAENFTVDEYKIFIKKCHEQGVKFYLTLNTLLKNNEISNILKLLNDSSFILPDAVISADIGLIIYLRQYFPTLDIHASTQLGVYTDDDLALLKQIGVKRAILARELTLNEIENLCKHTSLEIEVFVYGSQCISFSGQCIWGGVLNGCSGNRGRCIGMCRDLYQNNGKIGQYLYPQDINAVYYLKELENIGVKSAKIEGRLRSTKEISTIVRKFKDQTHSNSDENKFYVGYLANNLPAEEMFHIVNPRTKFLLTDYRITSKNDLCVQYINNKAEYTNGIKSNRFVKCIYTNKLNHKKLNISIRIIVKVNRANKFDFINSNGERRVFNLKSNSTNIYSINYIYNIIRKRLDYNIYEFTANVPSLKKIYIDLDEVDFIINQINHICSSESFFFENQIIRASINNIIETKSCETIARFKEKGYKKFIFDITDIASLKKAINLCSNDIDIIFKIPVLNFNINTNEIFKLLDGLKIMISKISHILYLKKYHFADVIGNYTLNIWNKESANFIREMGVSSIVYHPELSYQDNSDTVNNFFSSKYIISYGRLPLAYTRACFSELHICSQKCSESFSVKNISKGYSLIIECNNSLGMRRILSDQIVGAANYSDSYRIVLADNLTNSDLNKLLNFSILDYDIELYRRSVK